jgi:hypothetical protein
MTGPLRNLAGMAMPARDIYRIGVEFRRRGAVAAPAFKLWTGELIE